MIMKNINILLATLAILASLFMASCENGEVEETVIDGTDVNTVFVKTSTPVANVYNFSVVNTGYSQQGMSSVGFKIPAFITGTAKADVVVNFAIDNSLVGTYNEINKTTAKALPSGVTASLGEGKVTIHKGMQASVDSVTLTLSNTSSMTDPLYVVPVRITSITNVEGTKISSNLSTVYVTVSAINTNTYDNRTTAPAGTAQTSWTGWSVTSTPALTNPNNMFSTSTSSYATLNPSQELELVVDMASERTNIGGFRIHVSSTTYRWTEIEVATSSDRTNWTVQGTPLMPSSSTHYVAFYDRIPSARYVRVKVLSWPSSTASFRIAIFQAYW